MENKPHVGESKVSKVDPFPLTLQCSSRCITLWPQRILIDESTYSLEPWPRRSGHLVSLMTSGSIIELMLGYSLEFGLGVSVRSWPKKWESLTSSMICQQQIRRYQPPLKKYFVIHWFYHLLIIYKRLFYLFIKSSD